MVHFRLHFSPGRTMTSITNRAESAAQALRQEENVRDAEARAGVEHRVRTARLDASGPPPHAFAQCDHVLEAGSLEFTVDRENRD